MADEIQVDNKRTSTKDSYDESIVRVLMIDDQEIVGSAMKAMLEGEPGIEFHFCNAPKAALEMAIKIRPTVILQDLVMPDVDGLILVKIFRANPNTKDIPMVVLSSKEDAEIKYKAFQFGANDYMVKFPDKLEVVARLRYHSKAYVTLIKKQDALRKLEASQTALKKELDEAAHYITSLLPKKISDKDVDTDWFFRSSTAVGGDCFGYHDLCEENLALFLIDVCGHGVGAALLSVTLMNVLRSQTLDRVDFSDPSQVLFALNNTFDMDNQNGMYFTIWYGVYNRKNRTLSYACGGHPPAILIDKSGEKSLLHTPGMVIGGISNTHFETKNICVESGSRLFVFSDGVYEVSPADGGEMMSLEQFSSELARPAIRGRSKLESMFDFACAFQGSDSFADDFSIFEIDFK